MAGDFFDQRDKSIGRADFELCDLATPGGRQLRHALEETKYSPVDHSWPPFWWAHQMVHKVIEELRKAGWTVEPPTPPLPATEEKD